MLFFQVAWCFVCDVMKHGQQARGKRDRGQRVGPSIRAPGGRRSRPCLLGRLRLSSLSRGITDPGSLIKLRRCLGGRVTWLCPLPEQDV